MNDVSTRPPDRLRPVSTLVLVALFVKLLLALSDVVRFTGPQMDEPRHVVRAMQGGVVPGAPCYDGPLYYLPGLVARLAFRVAGVADPSSELIMAGLRALNLLLLAGTWYAWLWWVVPRILSSRWGRDAAGLAILAPPGYLRLVTTVHPDNLLMLGAVLSLAFVALPRGCSAGSGPERLWPVALLVGLTGSVRPFGCAVILVAGGGLLLRRARVAPRGGMRWAALGGLATLILLPAVTWQALRFYRGDPVFEAGRGDYLEPFKERRPGFDRLSYYGTFRFGGLLANPGRSVRGAQPEDWPPDSAVENSFWTLAYSELWGDHWLYSSGPVGTDERVGAKRVAFVAGLPVTLLLVAGTVVSLWGVARGAAGFREPTLRLVAGLTVVGFLVFVLWQGTLGLLPGKNSTVKFVYVAFFVAGLPVLAAHGAERTGQGRLAWAAGLVAFVVSLPLSVFP